MLPARRRTLPWAANFVGQHEIDPNKVDQYAAYMRGGSTFPPVRVVGLDGGYLIIDGHHRVAASREARQGVDAWIVDEEAFEDFDAANRHLGQRADDPQFWPAIQA